MAEMTIRRFGIFSVAKMQSLVMFVIGLIVGVIYGLFFMLFGAAISAFGARGEGSAVGGPLDNRGNTIHDWGAHLLRDSWVYWRRHRSLCLQSCSRHDRWDQV